MQQDQNAGGCHLPHQAKHELEKSNTTRYDYSVPAVSAIRNVAVASKSVRICYFANSLRLKLMSICYFIIAFFGHLLNRRN